MNSEFRFCCEGTVFAVTLVRCSEAQCMTNFLVRCFVIDHFPLFSAFCI